MDSWEGQTWGAKHVWGCEPVGEMMPAANLYPDIAEHGELLLFWGCDPETTAHPIRYAGELPRYWLTEIGSSLSVSALTSPTVQLSMPTSGYGSSPT